MAKGEGSYTLPKTERLHSKKLIDSLFGGNGSKSMSAFPIRMVYKAQTVFPSQILVSVPKRCLHRANKRNMVKRQIREAYRKNKSIIAGQNVTIAFIWLDNKLYDSATVERQVVNLLTRLAEKGASPLNPLSKDEGK